MMRHLLTLIWTIGYFGFVGWKIFQVWQVRVWSWSQLSLLYTKFQDGTWRIDTINEYILCVALVLFIPVWLFGVILLHSLCKKQRAKDVVRRAEQKLPPFVPMAIPSQGKTMSMTPAAPANETHNKISTSVVPHEEEKNELEIHARQTISDIAKEFGLTVFPHVLLKDVVVPLTVSSDTVAVLLQVLSQDVLWQVNFKDPLDTTEWVADGRTKHALKEIVKGRVGLSEMEPDAQVVSAVVLADGQIENVSEVQSTLKQHNIELVTLSPEEEIPGVMTFNDLLVKYFAPEVDLETIKNLPDDINDADLDAPMSLSPENRVVDTQTSDITQGVVGNVPLKATV